MTRATGLQIAMPAIWIAMQLLLLLASLGRELLRLPRLLRLPLPVLLRVLPVVALLPWTPACLP